MSQFKSMAKKKLEITVPEVNIKNILPKVLVGGLIIAAFVIGTLWQKVQTLEKAANTTTTTTGTAAQPTNAPISLDTIKGLWDKDLVKFGDASKKLLFVEVGDPSCPFCHAAAGENHDIAASLGPNFKLIADGGTYDAPVTEMRKLVDSGQASFIYVYFPGHGNGEMGMKSLYCANEKGKFWQAHDLLMSGSGYNLMNNTVKNDKTQSGTIANFLKGVVDPTFLKSCLDSGKYDSRLTADVTVASTLGVSGTPGFFVNATPFPGAYNWSDMKTAVDAALK